MKLFILVFLGISASIGWSQLVCSMPIEPLAKALLSFLGGVAIGYSLTTYYLNSR